MRVAIALAVALASASCAEVLGGLEEGRAAPPADAGALASPAAAAPPSCGSWLAGFAYRVPFDVQSADPNTLAGYSVAVSLPTRELISARKMRIDGADLRVTTADGVSVAPHWVQSDVGGDATTIWAKLDLASGENRMFVYYGNDSAADTSSFRDVFVDGIVDNGMFDKGSAPWIAVQPDKGGAATLEIRDGSAVVSIVRSSGTESTRTGWCQSVTIPAGPAYRFAFDVSFIDNASGTVAVWTGGLGGTPIWTRSDGIGLRRAVDTPPLAPGPTMLCIGGWLAASTVAERLSVQFANLRVRVDSPANPLAGPGGAEERACPP